MCRSHGLQDIWEHLDESFSQYRDQQMILNGALDEVPEPVEPIRPPHIHGSTAQPGEPDDEAQQSELILSIGNDIIISIFRVFSCFSLFAYVLKLARF